mgnify:CR=1 FL=1
MENDERQKCYELMREYGLTCSEFLHGHAWHMPDVEKGQWFVYVTPGYDDFRVATTVQVYPPIRDIEPSWHIGTTNTDRVNTYHDFKYVLDYLIGEYNKCKKELRELLIREAAHGYET